MAEIPFNNLTSNITIDSDQSTGNGSKLFMAVTTLGVVVSFVSLLYIRLKLVLNKFIKAILFIIALNHTVCFSIMTIANAIMFANNNRTELTCRLLLIPGVTICRTTVTFTTLLSVLRYL